MINNMISSFYQAKNPKNKNKSKQRKVISYIITNMYLIQNILHSTNTITNIQTYLEDSWNESLVLNIYLVSLKYNLLHVQGQGRQTGNFTYTRIYTIFEHASSMIYWNVERVRQDQLSSCHNNN